MSAIKGLDSFLDVLAVIKDPAKYEAKIAELQKATNEYKVVVESVVKLSEVNDYTANITKLKAEAEQAVLAAKAEAGTIVEKASDKAAKKLDAAKVVEDAAMAKQALMNAMEKELQDKEAALFAKDKELAKKESELNSRSAKLEALQVELDERAAKLRAALA